MATVGAGQFTYEVVENWGNLPDGMTFGPVSSVAVDSKDRVFAFQRKDPAVVILDNDGNYVGSWGSGFEFPHGIFIGPDDLVYLTDRDDHVAQVYTPDGELIRELGNKGQPSDTGCTMDGGRVLQAAGPFNKPTEIVPSPSGDLYVSDGYRNSRVHRFSNEGELKQSWGEPGKLEKEELHLPHSIYVDWQEVVYVCDRENSRVQSFTRDGVFLNSWSDVVRPTDIYMDINDIAFVSELAPRISVFDKEGNLLARWDSPSGHGIYGDSKGNLYLAEVQGQKITKYLNRPEGGLQYVKGFL
jgi:hypothetical protein